MADHDDLDDADRRTFTRLAELYDVPPGVERRVRDALVAAGLVRRRRSIARRFAAAAAAAALAGVMFWAGVVVGGRSSSVSSPDPRFLLLLSRDGSAVDAGRIREYALWARELRRTGRLVMAARLETHGETLARAADGAVGAIQVAEAPSVSGFFIVRAPTDQEALQLASTCPHLAYGGRVYLRRLAD